jgi:hypothetical protein
MTSSLRNPSAMAKPFQLHTVAGSLVEPELDLDRTSALDILVDESKFAALGDKSGDADPRRETV